MQHWGEIIERHNHVRDFLYKTAVQEGLAPVCEPEGLLERSEDRPAEVYLQALLNGKGRCLHFTCTNAFQAALAAYFKKL